MTVKAKICGIRTSEALEAALEGGADYVGLVFYGPSPRNVDIASAAKLAGLARGRAQVVALLVDAEDGSIADIVADVAPDLLQLHGSETRERVADIRARFGVPVMKVIKVETAADASAAFDYVSVADKIMFDAKAPKSLRGAMPGGNGIAFDWRALDAIRGKIDFMLSGGLIPDNVAEAMRLTGAAEVDVSSGVESRPGEKDVSLIRRFLQAAKTANQTA